MRFIVQCPIQWGDRLLQPGDEIDGHAEDPQLAVLLSAGGLRPVDDAGEQPVRSRSGAP